MAITNLLIKLKPEEIPPFMRGKFFELTMEPFEDGDDATEWVYAGWVHIKEDGTIEFGEPGV
jgi:hypothetical protein